MIDDAFVFVGVDMAKDCWLVAVRLAVVSEQRPFERSRGLEE